MGYSDAEIQEFRSKDLRISRLAILKSLIESCSEEDVYDVQKVTELAEKYIDYVYAERSAKRGSVGDVADNVKHTPNWEQLAIGLNLATPNATNIKILNQVLDEYKTAHKASANPKDVLVCCIDRYGTYPTKSSSAEKIVKQLLKG